MGKENTVGALAARIYSHVQKSGSNDAERNAAYAAWELLCKSMPELAVAAPEASARIIKRIAEQYMKLKPGPDSISDLSQMEAMHLQNTLQKRSEMFQMLSSIMKKQHELSKSVIDKLR